MGADAPASRPAAIARPRAAGGTAEALFRDGRCLSSGTAMREAELARVVGVIHASAIDFTDD
jgi:hypothetical protein